MKTLYFNFNDSQSSEFPSRHFVQIHSDNSWVDYDSIIIDTRIETNNAIINNDGSLGFSDAQMQLLNKYFQHVYKEVHESLALGKRIVFLLSEHKIIHSSSGLMSNNAKMAPLTVSFKKVRARVFCESTFFPRNLTQAWEEAKDLFKIECSLEAENLLPLLTDKSGLSVVAGYLKFENGAVAMFLPSIDYSRAHGVGWQCKIYDLIESFISEIEKPGIKSEAPIWANHSEYLIESSVNIEQELIRIEAEIESKKVEIFELTLRKNELESYKALLYGKSEELESKVRDALELLGFKVEHIQDNENEIDALFNFGTYRLLGEVEGRDNRAIGLEKLTKLTGKIVRDQTNRMASEDDEPPPKAKGVLFGNGFRNTEPKGRASQFSPHCISHSKDSSISLVRTSDLYRICNFLLNNEDHNYAEKCRNSIISNKFGIVEFPDVPTN